MGDHIGGQPTVRRLGAMEPPQGERMKKAKPKTAKPASPKPKKKNRSKSKSK